MTSARTIALATYIDSITMDRTDPLAFHWCPSCFPLLLEPAPRKLRPPRQASASQVDWLRVRCADTKTRCGGSNRVEEAEAGRRCPTRWLTLKRIEALSPQVS